MDWEENEFRLIFGRTTIDYNEEKEYTNRNKHKYSLSCAKNVFENVLLLQHPIMTKGPYFVNGEYRNAHMAEYNGNVVFLVTTMRDNETVHIISMRDASDDEEQFFTDNPPQFDISELLK